MSSVPISAISAAVDRVAPAVPVQQSVAVADEPRDESIDGRPGARHGTDQLAERKVGPCRRDERVRDAAEQQPAEGRREPADGSRHGRPSQRPALQVRPDEDAADRREGRPRGWRAGTATSRASPGRPTSRSASRAGAGTCAITKRKATPFMKPASTGCGTYFATRVRPLSASTICSAPMLTTAAAHSASSVATSSGRSGRNAGSPKMRTTRGREHQRRCRRRAAGRHRTLREQREEAAAEHGGHEGRRDAGRRGRGSERGIDDQAERQHRGHARQRAGGARRALDEPGGGDARLRQGRPGGGQGRWVGRGHRGG